MTRFQIILSQHPNAEGQPLLPRAGRFWRLKSVLAALLMASVVIGLVLAALFLGSIIAAALLILIAAVFVVAAVRAAIRRAVR